MQIIEAKLPIMRHIIALYNMLWQSEPNFDNSWQISKAFIPQLNKEKIVITPLDTEDDKNFLNRLYKYNKAYIKITKLTPTNIINWFTEHKTTLVLQQIVWSGIASPLSKKINILKINKERYENFIQITNLPNFSTADYYINEDINIAACIIKSKNYFYCDYLPATNIAYEIQINFLQNIFALYDIQNIIFISSNKEWDNYIKQTFATVILDKWLYYKWQ